MEASAEGTAAALDIECENCGAELVVEAYLKTVECPYCTSHSIVERPPTTGREEPTFGLAFQVEAERARAAVERWLKSRGLFAHSGLKAATLETVRGVYVPAYLYGAVAEADYSASIGENYTVTERYTDSKGRRRSRRRTKTEWRDLSGRYARYVVDVLVTASRGIPNAELEAVEPFDLRGLRRYAPAMLSGWIAEEPSLPREGCRREAHAETIERMGRWLEEFMPGDSHRDLAYECEVRDELIDLVLLPLWVFAARYDPAKPPVRVLLNGQTGAIAGKVPLSPVKIAVAVTLGLSIALAAAFAFLSARGMS